VLLKTYRPTSPGRRFKRRLALRKYRVPRALSFGLHAGAGRGMWGHIVSYHRRNLAGSLLRRVNFTSVIRVPGRVVAMSKDGFRSAVLGLVRHSRGLMTYCLLPLGVAVGRRLNVARGLSSGRLLPFVLSHLRFGTQVYGIRQSFLGAVTYVRSAGCCAKVGHQSAAGTMVSLPSGEKRLFAHGSVAYLGRVGARLHYKECSGKAGLMRYQGRRPVVRGTAMNPVDHPHGGKSGPGRSSVSPWGRPTK
jgi:large subunit ribosomal protein L2